MPTVGLLLGSNLGDGETYLQQSRKRISELIGALELVSSLYCTKAWGLLEQPDYINQVITVNTRLSPEEVLDQTAEIEKALGRRRKKMWDARTIDIDILFYDRIVMDTERLVIPHPRMHLRRFTLVPLSEILPLWIHPDLNRSIKDILENLDDTLGVKKI